MKKLFATNSDLTHIILFVPICNNIFLNIFTIFIGTKLMLNVDSIVNIFL